MYVIFAVVMSTCMCKDRKDLMGHVRLCTRKLIVSDPHYGYTLVCEPLKNKTIVRALSHLMET
jgi:hypothetical protein